MKDRHLGQVIIIMGGVLTVDYGSSTEMDDSIIRVVWNAQL